jgi:GxxExxY protein
MSQRLKQLVGICNEVYRNLGPGLRENIYQNALLVHLRELNLRYSNEVPIPIVYRGVTIGEGRLDVLVHYEDQEPNEPNLVPMELKAVIGPPRKPEIAQLRNYLRYYERERTKAGLLVNFPQPDSKGQCRDQVDSIIVHL